jgi:RNA polymerase sporulation-specific sigma factor
MYTLDDEKRYADPSVSQQLIQAAQAGDLEAQNQIILLWTPLLSRLSSRYFIIGGDKEDLIQEARIGLLKAIHGYDPLKNVDFRPFAKTCIHNHIISAMNEAKAQKHAALNRSVDLDSAALFSYDNPLDIMIIREQLEAVLSNAQSALSDLEKQVLLLYLDGISYRKIANQLQITEKSVSNALCRIRSKLS